MLEAIFKQILSKRLVPNAIASVKNSSKQESRDELLQEMQHFGFEVQETPFYYKDRVLATFRDYTRGTLMTLFYTWYYSEVQRDDSILSTVAGRCPKLIKLVDEVHANRGHNGKMDFGNKKLDYTKKHIDDVVNNLLDIMFACGSL